MQEVSNEAPSLIQLAWRSFALRTSAQTVASEGGAACGDAALIALDKADGDEIHLEVLVDLLNVCDKRYSAQLECEHRTEDILQYQELLEVTCLDMKRANGNTVEIVDAFYVQLYNTWSKLLAAL